MNQEVPYHMHDRHEELFDNGDHDVVFDAHDPILPFGVNVTGDNESARVWLSYEAVQSMIPKLPKAVNGDPVVAASDVSFNEGLLRLAAVHGKTVHFRYAKGDGAVIELRSLVPEKVNEVGGHVTFTGFDPDRGEPRAYRVDRMKGEVTVA
jgi:hypothetical protein